MKYGNVDEMMQLGRDFVQSIEEDEDYKTDQYLKRPQPPLVKTSTSNISIKLPTNFKELNIKNDFLEIINSRKSSRVYTRDGMSLLALSYLLWCTQGVKGIRGKSYATLRTVPSAGARHPFETYLVIQRVDGLDAGLYHYLPMTHEIELIGKLDDYKGFINKSVHGQIWVSKADVVFYYSFVCYRGEWRYGISSHRVALMDAGHVTENLYLACASIGLGTCAIGGVDAICDEVFRLDGKEEFMFYCQSVGTIKQQDEYKEKEFYRFVEEEGL